MSGRVAAIRAALAQALTPDFLEIEDQSAQHAGHAGVRGHGGGHFAVHIVAACFAGKSRLNRHRMVNDALDDAFKKDIHALSIRAESPDERAG
ncbi:MAG: BolA family protein [Mariprofundaceae bacterium]|nr:BolA family protein [Mariprofundaceae bacterium]